MKGLRFRIHYNRSDSFLAQAQEEEALAPPRSGHQVAGSLGDVAKGPRGTAPMSSGRLRARHLCLGFPTRIGDAPTQRGLAWVRGADAALGFPALRWAQEAGARA